MKKLEGKVGLGITVLMSCLFLSQTNVYADVTAEQRQLIETQVDQLDDKEESFIPGELIVGLSGNHRIDLKEKSSSNLFGINARVVEDLTLGTNEKERRNHNQVLLIQFSTALELSQVIKQLHKLPEVEYAEPNYVFTSDEVETATVSMEQPNHVLKATQIIPNDPYWSQMWGLQKIEMPTAWNKTTGSKNVKVAVIDSGVDYKHADLAANVDVSLGYDFVDNDADPQDGKGHGTHVAGTIGAKANNGLGVPGINWNVTMVPIRVLNNEGKGSSSNIIKGINWITEKKIPIANYSISGDNYSASMETAIKNYPGLFVGSAGNKGASLESNPCYPPALNISNMITVGNSDQQDQRSSSSSYSKTKVDLFAPGKSIFSTIPGSYGTKSGTSMAAPHVAGSAALALAQNPNLTTSQLKNKILNSVDKKASLSEFCQTGGRLNTAKLLD
ncbi:hypothetical protein BH747_10715 [Enterococcus villorum]|uniref:Uncharacterized protein n=1 Tax=Enterococcus villorum TaxID=112904 RepID=A0A1V8YU38_9ENTE|nr:S8 family peptidase [Enterococcus villorum]OQO69047.1 hypothetical protein BH747_10715 [Enterococcus villorum]OQO76140.1 hypothetical protein BH744_04795 [Enterococcus villorum]